MNWDLSALYQDERALNDDLKKAKERAKSFEGVCKGKLKALSVNEFLEAIRSMKVSMKC